MAKFSRGLTPINLAVVAAAAGLLAPQDALAQRVVTTFEFKAANQGTWSLGTTTLNGGILANPSTLTNGGNTYAYVTEQFRPEVSGTYDLGQSSAPLDTVMVLYLGAFDPSNPGTNAVIGNDDLPAAPAEVTRGNCGSTSNLCPGFARALIAGTEYTVVISHFRPTDIGTFSLPQSFYLVGPGGVLVGDVTDPDTEIDTSSSSFDEDSNAFKADQPTFNGGTLRLGSSQTVRKVILVRATNGTIDPNGQTLTLEGNIIGEGTLTLNGNGTVTINGTASNSGGFAVAGGATLGGTGTINGPTTIDNATLSPGNSPGVLTFNGDVSLSDQSTTVIEVDGATAGSGAGFHDRIQVNGADSTFHADGTLVVRLRGITGDANNTFSPTLGQVFDGTVQAGGGVTGSFDSLSQPTEGLPDGTRFDTIYSATEIDLVVTPEAYADLSPLGIGQTKNQRAVGRALDDVRPNAGVRASGDTKELFDALAPLDEETLPAALSSLTGQINADMMSAAFGTRRLFGSALMDRAVAVRAGTPGPETTMASLSLRSGSNSADQAATGPVTGTGAGEGPVMGLDPHLWARGVLGWSDVDGDGTGAGWEDTTGGFILGADAELVPGLTTGIAFSYLDTQVETDGTGGEADIGSYQVGLTGSAPFGPVFLSFAAGYGYSTFDTARTLSVGTLQRRSSGTTDGHSAFADVEAAYDFNLGAKVVLEPFIGARYDWLGRDGFTESGAGDLSLTVKDDHLSAVQPRLGARLRTRFTVDTMSIGLGARVAVAHDFGDDTGEASQSLLGSSFRVESPDPGRTALLGGVDLAVEVSERVDFFARYDSTLRDDAFGQSASAGLRLRF